VIGPKGQPPPVTLSTKGSEKTFEKNDRERIPASLEPQTGLSVLHENIFRFASIYILKPHGRRAGSFFYNPVFISVKDIGGTVLFYSI
jgi:hypothetical protein